MPDAIDLDHAKSGQLLKVAEETVHTLAQKSRLPDVIYSEFQAIYFDSLHGAVANAPPWATRPNFANSQTPTPNPMSAPRECASRPRG